jgi:hypothetical protein
MAVNFGKLKTSLKRRSQRIKGCLGRNRVPGFWGPYLQMPLNGLRQLLVPKVSKNPEEPKMINKGCRQVSGGGIIDRALNF